MVEKNSRKYLYFILNLLNKLSCPVSALCICFFISNPFLHTLPISPKYLKLWPFTFTPLLKSLSGMAFTNYSVLYSTDIIKAMQTLHSPNPYPSLLYLFPWECLLHKEKIFYAIYQHLELFLLCCWCSENICKINFEFECSLESCYPIILIENMQ